MESAKGRDPYTLDLCLSLHPPTAKLKAASSCSLSHLPLQPGQSVTVTFNPRGERGPLCVAWRQLNVP